MKAKNDDGEVRGQSDTTLGMLINRALSSEAKAYIRAGLPKVKRKQERRA